MSRRDRPRDWPWVHLVAYTAISLIWVTDWLQDPVELAFPGFPIAGWGIGVFAHFLSVRRHNDRVRARLAAPSTPTPALAAPSPDTGVSEGPIPTELAEEAVAVARLRTELAAAGRGQVAESLEMGLAEAARLCRLRGGVGDIDSALSAARAEADRLTTQAARATDAEAQATWIQSAESANRRIEKLEALRTVDERAAARIESFRQLVKSIAVDLARTHLSDLEGTATLADLAVQAHRVDRELDALHQTNNELRSLSRRAQGA